VQIFWFLLYNILIVPLLFVGFHIAALFNHKIRRGIQGRGKLLQDIENAFPVLSPDEKRILFHCASLGEFEQVKPILKRIVEVIPQCKRIVTFFSPSGYEHVGQCPYPDLAIYLPFDSLRAIRQFLNRIRPSAVIISKHDIWPNLVWALHSRRIPIFLINATMPKDSLLLKPILRSFYRSVFSRLNFVAPASETDRQLFSNLLSPTQQVEVIGDTRFDQVYFRSQESFQKKLLPQDLVSGHVTVCLGSTWPSDEIHLFPAVIELFKEFPNLLLIIVPHEPSPKRVEEIRRFFENTKLNVKTFSQIQEEESNSYPAVIIVDRIGILANLYSYSQIAYVGGSFGPGVHNVMEPAACGNTVLFGPRILNSPEAQKLVELGAGAVVNSKQEVYQTLRKLLADPSVTKKKGQIAARFIEENLGATEAIINKISSMMAKKGNRNIK